MDDPLFLLMQGIWLLATGMYPLGFLFGACSACCDQCPEVCSKCNLLYNNNDEIQCSAFVAEMGATVDGNVLFADNFNNDAECLLDIEPSASLRSVEVGCITDANGDPRPPFSPKVILTVDVIRVNDNCGCETVVNSPISLQLTLFGNVRFFADLTGQFVGTCDGATYLFTFNGWLADNPNSFPNGPECLASALEIINDEFPVEDVFMTSKTCDCGACCDNGCEENVAQGGCNSWQGVGVDCDPDPCV